MRFFPKKSDSAKFLPLGHSNFMWNFRKILGAILEKKCLITDILTHWPTDIVMVVISWDHFLLRCRDLKINFGTPTVSENYKFQKFLWACLAKLKLHDQFVALIDMKLHAQNEPNSSFIFWDLKVLIAPFGMPKHAWPRPPKITWSTCSFNRYVPACKKSIISFWDVTV